MRYINLTATLIFSVALVSAAAASEIYKWTDEDGNIHYTDTPQSENSEHLNIASRATDNSAVQAQTQARLEKKAAAAEAAANEPAGPTPEEVQAEKKEQAEKCSMYRERMTRFAQSRRLYREDENGERVYLDEAQTQKAREEVQSKVEEYCN